jgi:hypothetical protein
VYKPSGTSAKEHGSLELICGTKGLSIKAKVHWDRNGSNQNSNQSIYSLQASKVFVFCEASEHFSGNFAA